MDKYPRIIYDTNYNRVVTNSILVLAAIFFVVGSFAFSFPNNQKLVYAAASLFVVGSVLFLIAPILTLISLYRSGASTQYFTEYPRILPC